MNVVPQHIKTLSLMLATAVVAACETVPSSPNAGPAAGPTSAVLAGRLFADICLKPYPTFADTQAALATHGFTQNTVTSTYYLTSENLSVKLLDSANAAQGVLSFDVPANPDTCSMVFAANVDGDTATSQLAQGTASVFSGDLPPGISVTSNQRGGLTYVNARINAQ